ncbi:hypothetical protein HDU93_003243 [Gonapodya sp. JEL0774]|nr:hypothetical protein HDU93_003243 [Gonapodya sp. JEL0774]
MTDDRSPLIERQMRENGTFDTSDSIPTDYDDLLAVIDRLIRLAPLANQSVFLTDRQQRRLAIGKLSATVDRMSRGRMVDQRARLPDKLAQTQQLGPLVNQLNTAGSRRLLDQSYQMSPAKEKSVQLARVNDVCDRMGRQRMLNQDAVLVPSYMRRRNSAI